ncbi:PTS glucose transporter subunit IIA [Clostridium sp. MSJ-4]|uniref:PTS glucose transporter subunit IIA n=1 Tax=Clostridium simiarum TaxID=2841506 RepID=A0ABS6F5V7_9CLOT|nr:MULTISPECIES: PTS glucose transporter subunit IIA [Clostridium]MBU5593244.1 PTS glucose transporter subunit IIA [Clostridium simiarum]
MFGFLKKSYELLAPVTGKAIDLSQVPDEVFAQKMAGDGVAIDSTGDTFVAPADGNLTMIFKTNHAFAMTLDNGAEVLVHIGLDTVELQGEGFERLATEGSDVKAGTPIVRVNRDFIKEKGYSLITPILLTNPDAIKEMSAVKDINVEAGKNKVIEYKTK